MDDDSGYPYDSGNLQTAPYCTMALLQLLFVSDTQFGSISLVAFFCCVDPVCPACHCWYRSSTCEGRTFGNGASHSWLMFVFSAKHVNSQIQASANTFQCDFERLHETKKLQTWCVSIKPTEFHSKISIGFDPGPYHSTMVVSRYITTGPPNPHGGSPSNFPWVLDSHSPPWSLSVRFHGLLLMLTYPVKPHVTTTFELMNRY